MNVSGNLTNSVTEDATNEEILEKRVSEPQLESNTDDDTKIIKTSPESTTQIDTFKIPSIDNDSAIQEKSEINLNTLREEEAVTLPTQELLSSEETPGMFNLIYEEFIIIIDII